MSFFQDTHRLRKSIWEESMAVSCCQSQCLFA